MKRWFVLIMMASGTQANAGTPSCADAVDHAIAVSASDPQIAKMDATKRAKLRQEGIDECTSKPWSDTLKSCYVTAKDEQAVLACEGDNPPPDPDVAAALPVVLPAISADGTQLALPTTSQGQGDHHSYVLLVALGKSDGDQLDLATRDVEDKTVEDHTDAVAPQLAGYVALPSGSDTVDGVTMTVTGTKKKKVVFKVGKKVVGKTTIADGVNDSAGAFTVVRGKTSWVYLEIDHLHEQAGSSRWVAIKVKLPKPKR